MCTNPRDDRAVLTHVLTSSEDQTCKVFTFEEKDQGKDFLKEVQVLSGHTLAVTSIDWQRDMLVTCSDDRTIRVYQVQSANKEFAQLRYVLKTNEKVDEWHTLTYLTLTAAANSFLLSTVTENGYLFAWRLKQFVEGVDDQGDMIYSRKIHNGSIEALNTR